MQNKKKQLILGSQSPRRKELLQYTFLPFKIETCSLEEISTKETKEEIVMDLAFQKAHAVYENLNNKYDNPIVLGADTIVCIDGKILGKPKNTNEARSILLSLSGRSHEVLTGVCLMDNNKTNSFFERTIVEFETISTDLLEHYLATKESMDKAGAYGIQAHSLGFIKRIEGSYSNVVGLPVNIVINKLKEFLGDDEDHHGNWRKYFE